jgi:hypothetical protein
MTEPPTGDSNLLAHAKRELDLLGMPEAKDWDENTEQWDPDAAMRIGILDIIFNFSKQGHSGFSASYAIGALEKLLRFENLSPLTNHPDEWMDVSEFGGETNLWQNVRNSACFSYDGGQSYYNLNEKRDWVAKIARKLPHSWWAYLWDHHKEFFYPMHYTNE